MIFFLLFWIDWQSGLYLFCVIIGWFSLVWTLSFFLLLLLLFIKKKNWGGGGGGGGGIVLLYCSLANVCFVLIAWGESQKHSLGQKCCYLILFYFIFYFLRTKYIFFPKNMFIYLLTFFLTWIIAQNDDANCQVLCLAQGHSAGDSLLQVFTVSESCGEKKWEYDRQKYTLLSHAVTAGISGHISFMLFIIVVIFKWLFWFRWYYTKY